MRYFALAVDFDETLATHGHVPETTLRALEGMKATGRRLILVTGRTVKDLIRVWPQVSICDAVVAENGAILYHPGTRAERRLGPAPDTELVDNLRRAGIDFSAGDVVLSLPSTHAARALEGIRETGLDYHIAFNGGSAMVLPAGINKASGLKAALGRMELSVHEVVGIGNEANDRAFLEICECAVAVANALPSVKEAADFVTNGAASAGVEEIVAELIEEDLGGRTLDLPHSSILLGRLDKSRDLQIPAYGLNMLVAGPSGSGKSTFATALIERLMEKAYQVFVFDPEGDYTGVPEVVSLGDRRRPPGIQEILTILENPALNVSANLLGIPFYDRPQFYATLLPNLQAMRARTGRPHWIFVDEAHHFLPEASRLTPFTMPSGLGEIVMITVHPKDVAPEALAMMNLAIAVGPKPLDSLRELAEHAVQTLDEESVPATDPEREVLCWDLRRTENPLALGIVKGRIERFRHHRKYAEGDLGDKSFHFRGPRDAMNLKAQNLMLFVQIVQGIDEETWLHHLRRHDYSRWLRTAVKDLEIAEKTELIEARNDLSPMDSKFLISDLVTRKYSL